jgi:two-component sensor histidine kinase
MRFEPDHDPDPLRSKFKTIDSLDDLPADRTELMNDLKDKISEMLTIHEKNHPEDNSLVAYTAFQELQIHTLQHEIKNMYEVLMSMAAALDELKG